MGKHLGDGRSEAPAEKSLPNVRRETSQNLMRGKVRQKAKRVPVDVHLLKGFGNIESIFVKKKSENSATGITDNLRPSRREVKNDVWKYPQIIVIGLYTVYGYLLDNQDLTLCPQYVKMSIRSTLEC